METKLPFKKIQLLFGDVFGCPINESSVYSASMQCYEKHAESEQIIKSKVAGQDVVHTNETGVRIEGKLHWLHVATSQLYNYLFVHANRETKALKSEKTILANFKGWLVHYCWSSYFKFNRLSHSICGAHILRELEGLIENDNSRWAIIFKLFLMDVYRMQFEERLNRNASFTNNLAERGIGLAKVKQKISNCFRTVTGADIYARIEGFASTTRKKNRNVFSELCATFEDENFITTQNQVNNYYYLRIQGFRHKKFPEIEFREFLNSMEI